MVDLKKGDIVWIKPYCNPEGLIGEVVSLVLKEHTKYEEDIWVIKYLAGKDSFGRTHINVSVNDTDSLKIVKYSNIDTLRILYGRKDSDDD